MLVLKIDEEKKLQEFKAACSSPEGIWINALQVWSIRRKGIS